MRLECALLRAAPTIRHGFFGRQGGVSTGPWSSLNMALRTGDNPDDVLRNRALVAGSLGAEADRLVVAKQVHGTACLYVNTPWPATEAPEADALVTDRPGLVIGVTTADCAPILFVDVIAGVIGAAHAGWKGALSGVLESTVAAMVERGAEPVRIAAAIGPCIARASYEVGHEFRDRFLGEDALSESFFIDGGSGGRPHFDLEGYVASRLARAGLRQIQAIGIDTCADATRCFSYRRTTRAGGGPFGTQLSAMMLA